MELINSKYDIFGYIILAFILTFTILIASILYNTFWSDSAIYLVYAKNIAAFDFFSFNPGEFSTGSTSPIWAIILSFGFLLGNGVIYSKIISLVLVLAAIILTFHTSSVISNYKLGSAVGVGFLWYFLAFSGIMIYESGLTVCIISELILLNYYYLNKGRKNYLWFIGFIWMLLPLIRPECITILLFNLILLIYFNRGEIKYIIKAFVIALLSLIPFSAYYIYSYLISGILSVSSYSRSYALNVYVNYLPFSRYEAFIIFFTYPVVLMGFFIGAYGIFKTRNKKLNWLIYLFFTTLLSFIAIFMFYSPINNPLEYQRYMVYVIPFLVPFISMGIKELMILTSKSKIASLSLVSLIIITLVLVYPLNSLQTYTNMSEMTLKFDDVTEKNAAMYLNEIASPNSAILAYEVQDRYFLRDDLKVISLDGITDGKIVPYLKNDDITGFLWKYKPKYFIANKALNLPSYSGSILANALNKTRNQEGSSIKINGITFKNIKINYKLANPVFWSYIAIYELTYD